MKRNTRLASIPDDWFEKFLARIETWEGESSGAKEAEIDRVKTELAGLKAKMDRINNGFAEGSLDVQEFKELKNPLVPLKTGLEQRLNELEQSKVNRLEPLRNFIFEANQAQKWVKEENYAEMKGYLKKHGSNRLLRAQTLTVTFKKPASFLAETVLAVELTTSESERCSRWWRRGELNPRP